MTMMTFQNTSQPSVYPQPYPRLHHHHLLSPKKEKIRMFNNNKWETLKEKKIII